MIYWDVRESVQIVASQFAEFFCGVIFKMTAPCLAAFSENPFQQTTTPERRDQYATIGSQYKILEVTKILEDLSFPLNPATPLHFRPASVAQACEDLASPKHVNIWIVGWLVKRSRGRAGRISKISLAESH